MSVTALEVVADNKERNPGLCPSFGRDTESPSGICFPPLARSPVSFPMYRPDYTEALALRQEIESMMTKGALEIIPYPDPGFCSRLFLVEKASGGWRPVIDLSPLNEFVRHTPFKMETAASVLLFRNSYCPNSVSGK